MVPTAVHHARDTDPWRGVVVVARTAGVSRGSRLVGRGAAAVAVWQTGVAVEPWRPTSTGRWSWGRPCRSPVGDCSEAGDAVQIADPRGQGQRDPGRSPVCGHAERPGHLVGRHGGAVAGHPAVELVGARDVRWLRAMLGWQRPGLHPGLSRRGETSAAEPPSRSLPTAMQVTVGQAGDRGQVEDAARDRRPCPGRTAVRCDDDDSPAHRTSGLTCPTAVQCVDARTGDTGEIADRGGMTSGAPAGTAVGGRDDRRTVGCAADDRSSSRLPSIGRRSRSPRLRGR